MKSLDASSLLPLSRCQPAGKARREEPPGGLSASVTGRVPIAPLRKPKPHWRTLPHMPALPALSRRRLLRGLTATAFTSSYHLQVKGEPTRQLWVTGNDSIDKPRELALGLLKATPAQIERAWELHFGSLVFESYGFAPRCAIDGEAFAQAVKDGASPEELSDLREMMSMNGHTRSERERKEFLDAFRAAGVTCIFQNTGEEGSDPMRLLKRLAHFTQATDLGAPALRKVLTADHAAQVKADGAVSLCFTTNGVPLRQHWKNTRDELRLVRLFHELGVRMMHVTYNRRNPLGDGAGEPHDGGLSDFGREAVAAMNRAGVIVDVAHSGWKTSLDAARASSKPMVASHSACADVYRHFRSKPDTVIRAIADTGGYLGVAASRASSAARGTSPPCSTTSITSSKIRR
jgi:membrane dipeptidase